MSLPEKVFTATIVADDVVAFDIAAVAIRQDMIDEVVSSGDRVPGRRRVLLVPHVAEEAVMSTTQRSYYDEWPDGEEPTRESRRPAILCPVCNLTGTPCGPHAAEADAKTKRAADAAVREVTRRITAARDAGELRRAGP